MIYRLFSGVHYGPLEKLKRSAWTYWILTLLIAGAAIVAWSEFYTIVVAGLPE